ncbi:MAG: tetratricopeptide repeat protein [Candidatus Cloacimonadota bacterium]|nr:MAG: tetratricopeptide repeat protein [Candidatus Cloacimonadota bacterium]
MIERMEMEMINRAMKYKVHIFILIIPFVFSGCAYYNTFYNAKTAYNKAMKSKENAPNKKAPVDLLDKVIEKCGKVMKYHSKSRWVDDAITLMGKAYLEKGEYDKALRKFEELVIYYPESPFAEEALYLTGVTYLQRDDYSLAIGSFNQILNMKKGVFADDACYMIVESYYKKKDYDNLLDHARNFLTNFPGSAYLPKTLLLMGNVYLQREEYAESAKILKKARASARKREDKNSIDEKYAVVLIKMGNIEEGLSILKDLSERTILQERTATLSFEIVNAYIQEINFDRALKELDNFISLYPSGRYAAEAFYRKGIIYEENLGDAENAIAAYDNALKLNPADEIRSKATKKTTVLKEIAQYRKIIANPDSSTDLSKIHFLLAETYLFGKANADTAIIEYKTVLDNYSLGPLAPRAAMALAWIHEYDKQDTSDALEMYKLIIENFPLTEYSRSAEEALKRLMPDKQEEEDTEEEGGTEAETSGEEKEAPEQNETGKHKNE